MEHFFILVLLMFLRNYNNTHKIIKENSINKNVRVFGRNK